MYRNKLKMKPKPQQSGVIPYRKNEQGLEVLLITSMTRKNWIIPKGYIESDLSAFESAKKEAFEEAGIIGSNETIELGSFVTRKNTGKVKVLVFSMEVIKELDDFPERKHRKRKWFSIDDAVDMVKDKNLKVLIQNLPQLLNSSSQEKN